MTYQDILRSGVNTLKEVNITEAELDARLLLEEAFGINRGWLLAHLNDVVDITKESISLSCDKYIEYIDRRKQRIPLQHIVGYVNFMGLRFEIDENVLIPRQDTEVLVEEALRELHDGMRLLDMCTGSGCILTSLLYYSNECEGVGVDYSASALRVARNNAERLLKDREGSVYSFCFSDMFEDLTQDSFDIIVSNPPYIESEIIKTLEPEVREHDPLMALDGGSDGLKFYRIIAQNAPKYLRPGGQLFLEIGANQAEEVSCLLNRAGFNDIQVVKDLSGLDRVVIGRKQYI